MGRPLQNAYSLLAPVYDLVIARATRESRRRSLGGLAGLAPGRVLLVGIGTGLDLPLLPVGHRYLGLDLTAAMLRRAGKGRGPHCALVQGDALELPFADGSFDHVVMHLILAVVPQPSRALSEALRVLRSGGSLRILDKFLRPGQRAPLRRLAHPLVSRLATRLDVVWEEVASTASGFEVLRDEPEALGGWFRRIELQRR